MPYRLDSTNVELKGYIENSYPKANIENSWSEKWISVFFWLQKEEGALLKI